MSIELVSGKELLGRVKRFGDFVVVIETEGKELLVYKPCYRHYQGGELPQIDDNNLVG